MNTLRTLGLQYDRALRSQPLLVKMMTSGTLVAASDATVQVFSGMTYDPIRSFVIGVGYGSFSFAPILHGVTTGWSHVLPATTLARVLLRSSIDMVTSFPCNLSASIAYQTLGRSKDFSYNSLTVDVPAAIRSNLWPSLVPGWALWLPVGALNYSVVPVRYQVLVLNSVSFFWNVFMVWRYTDGSEARAKQPDSGQQTQCSPDL